MTQQNDALSEQARVQFAAFYRSRKVNVSKQQRLRNLEVCKPRGKPITKVRSSHYCALANQQQIGTKDERLV
ncbi:hypothetical protein J7438_24790 [Thalassotalea sp. G20_0]|uniref:hypothetical protein n=1 Tax=Thalassotalea sp. G20_0 TaxID=2821093 RepID=UPI001ADBC054|nr:hypothetical protein [Thalassotalea sp. G20_0]MBO9497277.1 hypothetical protein [Thalassotalea sp. G20_0]